MESAIPTFYDRLAQWSEIVGGFAFVVVAIVLFAKYLLPAVRAGQVSRNADLVNAEQRREALKAEVGRGRAEVEAADRDAQSIKKRAADDSARERERLVAEATADGERAVATAHGELRRSRAAAQADLRNEFVDRALALARANAAARIDAATNARLVGATVDTLVRDSNGRPA